MWKNNLSVIFWHSSPGDPKRQNHNIPLSRPFTFELLLLSCRRWKMLKLISQQSNGKSEERLGIWAPTSLGHWGLDFLFDEDSKHTSYFCTHRGPQGTREAKDSDSNIMMLRTFSKPSSSVFSSVSPRVSPKGLIDVGASIRTPPSQFQYHLPWLLYQNKTFWWHIYVASSLLLF